MKFLHPQILWLLLLVPALVAAYVALIRRRGKHVIRYASFGAVKEAVGTGQRLRRHVPPLLFLLAQILLIVACAGPTAVVTLPYERETIILAMDVSLSMGARDVDPNRLSAAQTAAKAFVQERPPNVNIGLVAFGATASLVQPPTDDRDALLAAIDRFELQRGTATGSALYVALQTLFPDAGIDLESLVFPRGFAPGGARARSLDAASKGAAKPLQPVAPGSYKSAVIVLLSDGRRTTGPDPLDAARMAADRGVRIFTVGVGTAQGAIIGFGLVGLCPSRRRDAQGRSRGERRRVLPCRHLRRPEEGLQAADHAAQPGEEGHRDHVCVRRTGGDPVARGAGFVAALVRAPAALASAARIDPAARAALAPRTWGQPAAAWAAMTNATQAVSFFA